jgi:hypothetical protein
MPKKFFFLGLPWSKFGSLLWLFTLSSTSVFFNGILPIILYDVFRHNNSNHATHCPTK